MRCRVCDFPYLELALDLGEQPWANNFLTKDKIGTEKKYPLRVMHCGECRTAQLDYTVPKETMFGDHTYRSGTTKSLNEHFMKIARETDILYCSSRAGKSVLDIGSNDGTQLRCFKALGYDVLGVESSVQTAKFANDSGIETINEFFNEQTAKSINRKFDVINAAGVFFHLEELHSVCEGIRLCLKDDGVFVVQFIYAKTMIENGAFDQIYHEHLLYYTLETVHRLLTMHGLFMFDAYLSPIHGGSIIGFVKHEPVKLAGVGWHKSDRMDNLLEMEGMSGCNNNLTWLSFGRRIKNMKEVNLERLSFWKAEGKRVYGMGAPVKGNTLLNTFGVTTDLIECLTERNPLRKGLYAPGSHIPVVMEDEVEEPDVQYVLAWNFRDEILKRNQPMIDKGVEFYFPVNPKGIT